VVARGLAEVRDGRLREARLREELAAAESGNLHMQELLKENARLKSDVGRGEHAPSPET